MRIRISAAMRDIAYLLLGLATAGWAFAHTKSGWVAPEEAKKLKNPVPMSEASVAAGKSIYAEKCLQCHGETGKGDGSEAMLYSVKPADLSETHMMDEMTDGELFWKISEGRRPMLSYKKQLTEEQRWQVVNYIRTLAARPAPAAPAKTHSRKP